MDNNPTSYADRASAFADGSDPPRDFLERCLTTIEAREPVVKAFVTMNIDGAREAADHSTERYRAGAPLSPVDGLPVGIKDVIETQNMPTQMGSPIFDGWQSEGDAACITALREAGAIVLGKVVTCEFAAMYPGATTNPHDPERTPGGSSSGSAAAVGAEMVPAALGTQALGSITRPASYCGAYGYKPTLGAINRRGCHDHVSQSTVGAFGASLADCWAVTQAIASRVGGAIGYPGLYGAEVLAPEARPRRVIRLETAGWADASGGAKAQFEDALSRIDAAGVEIVDRRTSPLIEAFEQVIAGATPLTRRINAWEFRWPLAEFYQRGGDLMSPVMRQRLEDASNLHLDDYRQGIAERDEVRATYDALSRIGDVCLLLGATGAAPLGLESTGNADINVPASLLGAPALSLPLLSDAGLPLGLQLMGFHHRDEDLMGHAWWVEGVVRP